MNDPEEFNLTQAEAVLRRTPAVLRAMLDGLPPEWTMCNEGRNEGAQTWSPFDVLGHLIHAEQTDWIPRARMILDFGETRPFEPFDRYAMLTQSAGKTVEDLLAGFDAARNESLRALRKMALTPQHLSKRGLHPELGAVTLGQLIATWVAHDLSHLVQISRTMARQYRDAVGPWQAYLSVMK